MPATSYEESKAALRDARGTYAAFAWMQGKRGGRYWLPDGKQDVAGNRLYGAKAEKAAAAGGKPDSTPQQSKPTAGRTTPGRPTGAARGGGATVKTKTNPAATAQPAVAVVDDLDRVVADSLASIKRTAASGNKIGSYDKAAVTAAIAAVLARPKKDQVEAILRHSGSEDPRMRAYYSRLGAKMVAAMLAKTVWDRIGMFQRPNY